MTCRVLVVDDEPLARRRLVQLLEPVEGYVVCGEAGNGEEALALLADSDADLLLLDIAMPGIDGLQLAAELNRLQRPPAIIFCTAYDRYLLDAFARNAVGYLIKPVRPEALEQALANSRRLSRTQLAELDALRETDRHRHLCVRSARGVELVDPERIALCEADSKYVTLFHDGRETVAEVTLKQLEADYPELFLRIHRNALAGVRFIKGLQRDADGTVHLELDGIARAPTVSRRHAAAVRERLAQL